MIIMQLLTVVIPALEKLSKEPDGRKKITQYTRYGTVILSIVQGLTISFILLNPGAIVGLDRTIVTNPGWMFHFVTVITLMAGTSFVMWLGEQITERGIGQGISLIITIGILAGMPGGASTLFGRLFSDPKFGLPQLVIFMVLAVIAIMGTVYIQLAVRKIPVQYARRVVGRKVFGGQTTHLPLRVNAAGMIPIIFAVTLIQFLRPLWVSCRKHGGWVEGAGRMFRFGNAIIHDYLRTSDCWFHLFLHCCPD